MGTANNERVIDITKIYERLGELTCKSILGFHASTGCDHNPAFFNKGNKRPFSILKKKHYQEAFAALGDNIEKLCPSALQPQEHGWIYDEDKYFLKWFDGGQLPGFVAESVQSPSEKVFLTMKMLTIFKTGKTSIVALDQRKCGVPMKIVAEVAEGAEVDGVAEVAEDAEDAEVVK
ncbi:hypothetical protein PV328_007675 [Microctonus aethiopoides]|uniref:Uncharacterized protein n=1 Tax=Microctonus aethiopoides TaxID=144406 RepID=A0AA39EYX9_9HYME|nr:hypothetical protein PV328_007675 [Microctonus aethiopoides]